MYVYSRIISFLPYKLPFGVIFLAGAMPSSVEVLAGSRFPSPFFSLQRCSFCFRVVYIRKTRPDANANGLLERNQASKKASKAKKVLASFLAFVCVFVVVSFVLLYTSIILFPKEEPEERSRCLLHKINETNEANRIEDSRHTRPSFFPGYKNQRQQFKKGEHNDDGTRGYYYDYCYYYWYTLPNTHHQYARSKNKKHGSDTSIQQRRR